jgi:putative endonuclease
VPGHRRRAPSRGRDAKTPARAAAARSTPTTAERHARERWFVYLLRCADGSLYAGCTNDLARRVAAHDAGKGARYTRSRRPVTLVFWEGVRGRSRALSKEARLKQLTRAEKLALIARRALRPLPRPAWT